jgi:hypothetical protein
MILKRHFWTIKKGISTGYVETFGKVGVIFTHDDVKFRNTSSNIAHGSVANYSIDRLSNEKKEKLREMMLTRKPINVMWKQDVIGNPIYGYVGTGPNPCYYIVDVDEI